MMAGGGAFLTSILVGGGGGGLLISILVGEGGGGLFTSRTEKGGF
jgi:hypothetical protein